MLMPLKKPMNQPPKPFQLRPQLRKLVRKLQLKKLQQLKNQPRKDQPLKKPQQKSDFSSYDDKFFSYDDSMYSGACSSEWIGDGECDRPCNTPDNDYDEGDCFHGDDGCYTDPTGIDYRGSVNVTKDGKPCQFWDSQRPNPHTYTVANLPDANMGGHNSCRNPAPEEESTGPWCLIDSYDDEEIWGYCDVGAPSTKPCANSALRVHNHTHLALNSWAKGRVLEHRYNYYKVDLPDGLAGFQVVVVPKSGDPNLYVDFDTPFPTGHSYTYKQDDQGPEVFYMTSQTFGYCAPKEGPKGPGSGIGAKMPKPVDFGRRLAVEDAAKKGCVVYLSVSASEDSDYHIVVYDTGGNSACGAGCAWKQLGDGECQPQCMNDACFNDLGDCSRPTDSDKNASSHCHSACSADWIGDGYCDAACFNAKCDFDGEDCGGHGCADGCMKRLRGNGECDAACNVESCHWDSGDCFHAHAECYNRADGSDYRGTVSHTSSGKVCQRWSDQDPNVHTRTHEKFPLSGLGGHNFCRNPDGSEKHPWCYTTDALGPRFETCEVGEPQAERCPPPPPPLPRGGKGADKGILSTIANAVAEDSTPGATLGIGLVIGAAIAGVLLLIFLVAVWKYRGRMAQKGMYTFGSPPGAELAEVGDDP